MDRGDAGADDRAAPDTANGDILLAMTAIAFTLDELEIPELPGATGWNDFVAMVALQNAVDAEVYGSEELNFTPEELLSGWRKRRYEPKRVLVARSAGRIVARATFERLAARDVEQASPDSASAAVAWLSVQVLPECRRNGIGSALTDMIEALAAHDGCRTLIVCAASAPAPGPTLPSPTGFGAVPLGNSDVHFLLQRGYRLEQVERASRLALPIGVELLTSFAEQAAEFVGTNYIVHCWRDDTPPAWREDIALLYTRMSTDAPTASLQKPEDVWTAERLVAEEHSLARSPRLLLTAAARHIPTDRLVGFSQLSVPAEEHRPVSQQETLVLREHRGHRLGMLLKVANLHYLKGENPGHPSIIAFNAEENRHLLAVNEALGFVPIGYKGTWRRSLPPTAAGSERVARDRSANTTSDRD